MIRVKKNSLDFSCLLRRLVIFFMMLAASATFAADCNGTSTYPDAASCSVTNFPTQSTISTCTTSGVVALHCSTTNTLSVPNCTASGQCTAGSCNVTATIATNSAITPGTYNGFIVVEDPCRSGGEMLNEPDFSLIVSKASQTISLTSAPVSAPAGTGYTPNATSSSGLPVSISIDSASTGNCLALGGEVTYKGIGTCIINANQTGNQNYNAAPQIQQTTTVTQGTQTINFTSTAPTNPPVGTTYPVAATATSGLAVTFSSGTPATCSVTGSTVTLIATGLCRINANQSGNASYSPAPQAEQTVTAVKGNQTITFTSTAPTNPPVGATYPVAATATSGLAVTFSSGTPATCSVTGSTVTFIATGLCRINANQIGNANYNPAPQAEQTVTAVKGNQTITFTSTPVNPSVGGEYTPTATATSGLAVTFSIATPGTCSIANGVVTYTAAGTCTINADQVGNDNYNPAPQEQQNPTVSKGNQTITFTSTPVNPSVGGEYTPTAIATSGLAVTFSIATPGTCSIANGVVTYTAAGTCTINADQVGNDNYNPAPQEQQNTTVSKGSQTITITTEVPPNPPVGTTYTPEGTGGGSGNPVIFTIDPSSTPGACSISGDVVTFLNVGTCIIDANQDGGPNYDPAPQIQQTTTVTQATQTIVITSQPPVDPEVGGKYVVTAGGGDSGNPVIFTVDPGSTSGACSVNGNEVSFTGPGTCIIDANQAGNANYVPAPQVQQIFNISLAPLGSLTIVKKAIGRDGSFSFTTSIAGAGVLSLSTTNGSAQHTYTNVPIGTYNLRETELPPGWQLTGVQCDGMAMDANAVTVNLTSGSNITCVFTNTFDEAMIRQKTLESIATFINHRAHMILAAAPDRRRIVQILSKTLQPAPAAQPVLSEGRMGMRMSASLGGLEQALTPRNLDFWTQVQVDYFSQRQGNFSRDHAQFGLVYVGADYLYSDRLLLGALVQFDMINENNILRSNIKASGQGWMAGPYLSARLLPDLYFHTRMAFGTSNNKINPFHFKDDTFHTFRQLYNAEVMGNFMLNGLRVAPTLGVTWFNERQEGYINTLDVHIPSQNLNLGQLNVGPELGYPLYTSEKIAALLRLSLQAIYNFQETGYLLLQPVGNLSSFYGRINLGADILTNRNISLYPMVVWDGVGGNFENVGGQIQIRANLDD